MKQSSTETAIHADNSIQVDILIINIDTHEPSNFTTFTSNINVFTNPQVKVPSCNKKHIKLFNNISLRCKCAINENNCRLLVH